MGYFFYLLLLIPIQPLVHHVLHWLRRRQIPVLSLVIAKLILLGILLHELCHFLVMKLLRFPVTWSDIEIKPKKFAGRVKWRNTTDILPRITFMKLVVVCFAQLFLGVWAILHLTEYWAGTSTVGKVGIGVALLVLIYASQPSKADIKTIFTEGISARPGVAFRQLVCEGLSVLIYLLFADFFNPLHALIPMIFEPVVILGIFCALDLICMGLNFGGRLISIYVFHSSRDRPIKKSKYKVPYFPKPLIEDSQETYILQEDY